MAGADEILPEGCEVVIWPKRVEIAKQTVLDTELDTHSTNDLSLELDSLIDACRQEWSAPRDLLDPDIPPVERAERVAQQLSHSKDKEDHVLAAVIQVLIAIARSPEQPINLRVVSDDENKVDIRPQIKGT